MTLIPKAINNRIPLTPAELIKQSLLSEHPVIRQLAMIADELQSRRHDTLGWS